MFGKRLHFIACFIALLTGLCVLRTASADVFNLPAGQTNLQFVTVGDPGNAPDSTTGFGSVAYTYEMGEFDVTGAQYTVFLNAVAASNSYNVYNPSMYPGGSIGACGIIQSGSPGSYTYSYVAGSGNFPVNNASWGDAARFCNWLDNGQPDIGVENASTTEDGSYALNGAATNFLTVTRLPTAKYVIPTQNEWYKSAYYQGGSTNTYSLYPTQSNSPPSNVLSTTGTNNANFDDPVLGFTDPVNFLTSVGSFSNSPSAWGTFDQGGDVYQWTEGLGADGRVIRGGAFDDSVGGLESNFSDAIPPSSQFDSIGFRIAEVPEPTSLGLLAIGTVGLLRLGAHK